MKHRTPWTEDDLRQLRELYPDHKADHVAKQMGRTTRAVHQKAKQMSIGKSDAFKKSFISGRIQAASEDPRMVATRFQKGLVPWNKGVAGSVGHHDNCRKHQFKKGNVPSTWVPVGSYRINTSKGLPRLERKMNDKPGPNHVRWIPVSRLVWEQHHGPVPEKHIVIFKETRLATTVLEEITVDKLLCITRAENAQRNHPAKKSPELSKLYQLKGAITRQVNRINRESKEDHEPATTPHQRPARAPHADPGQPARP